MSDLATGRFLLEPMCRERLPDGVSSSEGELPILWACRPWASMSCSVSLPPSPEPSLTQMKLGGRSRERERPLFHDAHGCRPSLPKLDSHHASSKSAGVSLSRLRRRESCSRVAVLHATSFSMSERSSSPSRIFRRSSCFPFCSSSSARGRATAPGIQSRSRGACIVSLSLCFGAPVRARSDGASAHGGRRARRQRSLTRRTPRDRFAGMAAWGISLPVKMC